jgi:hypothetical protein
MNVNLIPGRTTVITDRVTTHKTYGFRTPENQFTADVVVEIDHTALMHIIRKAQGNKSKRSSDGPITVKLSNIKVPNGQAS